MMKRISAIIMIISLLATLVSIASASILSDPVFDIATTNLTSTRKAYFDVETSSDQGSIEVTRVRLYQKVGDTWYYVGDLPVPTKKGTNTHMFSANYDYSSYIGTGTYRLYTTFSADGYSISRYSNTRTF